MYDPKVNHYNTNPISDICEYYDIDWEDVWWMDWHVEYDRTIRRVLENKNGEYISISLFRMPSGRYEAVCYNAGKARKSRRK